MDPKGCLIGTNPLLGLKIYCLRFRACLHYLSHH